SRNVSRGFVLPVECDSAVRAAAASAARRHRRTGRIFPAEVRAEEPARPVPDYAGVGCRHEQLRLAGQHTRTRKFYTPGAGANARHNTRSRFVWVGNEDDGALSSKPAEARRDAAGSGAVSFGSDITGYQRKSHADGGNDGREPADSAKQN